MEEQLITIDNLQKNSSHLSYLYVFIMINSYVIYESYIFPLIESNYQITKNNRLDLVVHFRLR